MKSNKISIIVCALIAVSFSSCDISNYFNQVENVDLGEFKSTLTPNCQLNDAEAAIVSVDATKPAFGSTTGYDIKGDATVKLYENDVLLGAYTKDSSTFYYNWGLVGFKPGKAYKLEVSHPNYPTCTAVDSMPAKVPFTVVKTGKIIYQKNTFNGGFGGGGPEIIDTLAEILITFNDAVGNDYYRLVISDTNVGLKDGSLDVAVSQIARLPISYDPIFSSGLQIAAGENYVSPNQTYFDDLTFNGKQKTISLFVQIGALPFSGPLEGIVKPKLYIALQHHSRASYLRNKSLQDLQNSNGNPFTQPTLLYCNTVGGYGILATSSTHIDSVMIK
jgi:hypothetical protein